MVYISLTFFFSSSMGLMRAGRMTFCLCFYYTKFFSLCLVCCLSHYAYLRVGVLYYYVLTHDILWVGNFAWGEWVIAGWLNFKNRKIWKFFRGTHSAEMCGQNVVYNISCFFSSHAVVEFIEKHFNFVRNGSFFLVFCYEICKHNCVAFLCQKIFTFVTTNSSVQQYFLSQFDVSSI